MSPLYVVKTCRISKLCLQRESGSGLVMVMLIVCVLSVVAGSLLLINMARYNTTFQSASWQESIVASEAGVDLAMNELRRRAVQSPSASFQTGWTTSNVSSGKAYSNFGHAFPATSQPYSLPTHGGEGNTSTQIRVYVDVPGSAAAPSDFAAANDTSFISQLDNPNLRDPDGVDRSRWWFRIRALGIAGVSGPPRPNIDKRDNRLRQISFFNDWRTGQNLPSPQAARMVEAVARPLTNFRNALMASTTINLSNQDVLIDSYDSSQGLYSATNVGTLGNIATNGQLINANNATVEGDALTNNGTVTNGSQISGQQSNSFYQELTPVTPAMLNPAWSTVADGGTITANTHYTASTDSSNPTLVRLDGINLPDGATLSINGPASTATTAAGVDATPSYIKIYVEGDITTVGASQIVFAPNVNAIVYFTGNVSLQGNGIFNDTMLASNLVLNGVQPPVNANGTYPARSISIATNQDFEGIIYAPNHDLDLALEAASVASVVAPVTTPTAPTPKGPKVPKTPPTPPAPTAAALAAVTKQVNALNTDITKQTTAYENAMAKYATDSAGPGGASGPAAVKDLQQAAKDQAKINQDTLQIQTLQGGATASQTDDHARGYNGIYGTFVANTILVESATHVHYDETLRTAGAVNHYEIVNWFEDHGSRDFTGGAEEFWWRPGGMN